jgi:hypothetical protein
VFLSGPNDNDEDLMRLSPSAIFATALFVATSLASWPARAADPTTADCLSASEKSLSMRNDHKLRDARAQALICAAVSCPADVRDECVRRVTALNTAMPTIVFEAKDPSGNDLSAVKVTMDGQVLAERLEGAALSIDPGQHAFAFEAAGQPVLEKQFVIVEGEKGRRERLAFGAAPRADSRVAVSPPVPVPEQVAAGSAAPPAAPEGRVAHLGTHRTLALVSAGVGVIGLGLGVGFGLDAMSKHDDAQKACPGTCSNQSGVGLWNEAVSAGYVSTVGFIVGAAGLVGGTILWLTAKPEPGNDESVTTVGLGLGSIVVKGAW